MKSRQLAPANVAPRRMTIEEAGVELFDCEHKTPAPAPSGIPYIAIPEMKEGRLDVSKARLVATKDVPIWNRRVTPREGDIILSRRTNPGVTAVVPAEFPCVLGQNLVILRSRGTTVDQTFLRWVVRGPEWWQQIEKNLNVGAVFDSLRCADIPRFELTIPPLPEQRAIAHILGTLDDKIESNRRMNETLEAMARALFKSWFVDFDPVRAKAEGRKTGLPPEIDALFPDSFEESELGEIPKAWRTRSLGGALRELVSGSRPKGGAIEEGVPSVGAENVIGLGRYDFSKEKFVPREFFEALRTKGAAIQNGDVLLYKDGAQIGRKTYFDWDFPHSEAAINEHVFILRASPPQFQRFLFFWLDQPWMTQRIISLNSTSAQPGINQPAVRGLPILLPTPDVVRAFDDLVAPFLARIFGNCKESRTLPQIQDALLPKLLSAEVKLPAKEVEG